MPLATAFSPAVHLLLAHLLVLPSRFAALAAVQVAHMDVDIGFVTDLDTINVYYCILIT